MEREACTFVLFSTLQQNIMQTCRHRTKRVIYSYRFFSHTKTNIIERVECRYWMVWYNKKNNTKWNDDYNNKCKENGIIFHPFMVVEERFFGRISCFRFKIRLAIEMVIFGDFPAVGRSNLSANVQRYDKGHEFVCVAARLLFFYFWLFSHSNHEYLIRGRSLRCVSHQYEKLFAITVYTSTMHWPLKQSTNALHSIFNLINFSAMRRSSIGSALSKIDVDAGW